MRCGPPQATLTIRIAADDLLRTHLNEGCHDFVVAYTIVTPSQLEIAEFPVQFFLETHHRDANFATWYEWPLSSASNPSARALFTK